MADIKKVDRKALRILTDAVSEKLGPADKVTRELQRAHTSGKQIDRFMAGAAFDALPGPHRSEIGSVAENLAHTVNREEIRGWDPFSTERNWREMNGPQEWTPFSAEHDWRSMDVPQRKARRTRKPAPDGDFQSPPRFLSRTPR